MATLHRDVAEGIHRIEHAHVNMYLVEGQRGEYTLVDAGPGHTFGHTALHFPERDALITGDALVTLDPYTGERGPQIVSGAATADSAQAFDSLAVLRDAGATTVLPGHGESWTGGIADATELARRRGPH